jgi:ribonuclease HII
MGAIPSLGMEQQLWAAGYRYIAGVDEAGRGALAGPVVAAAVVIGPESAEQSPWHLVRDSKQLAPPQRTRLEASIKAVAVAWGIGCVPAAVIDQIGIAAATRQAMAQAIQSLTPAPDYLLIDWVRLPLVNIPQHCAAKADATMVSVAAASILAKVHRDRLMVALDAEHPAYGFAAHKGYGAAAHLAALTHLGPCPEHRHSFAPIAQAPGLFVEVR